jgi:hypothetical protein
LVGSAGERGEKAYTGKLEQNFFQTLSAVTRDEFLKGKGGELSPSKAGICKMQAVHSSSALAVNLFGYWRNHGSIEPLLRACRLAHIREAHLEFEAQLPIADILNRRKFPVDPHIDVLIKGISFHLGIESKFSEAYCYRGHKGLKRAYLAWESLWMDIPDSRQLGEEISPIDHQYSHLHPAQLLKHILGLKHACRGKREFMLLYLWYDVPFKEGEEHRKEIERFGKIMKKDGIKFQAITYQELILEISRLNRSEHQDYVNYITERYL